jgi:hypothetical protein
MKLYLDSNHQRSTWHPLECISNYQKWPHQPLTTKITIMELVANLQQCKHEWKPMIVDKNDFIIGKGNEFNTFNQRFGFVENQFMRARCHLPITCV